MSIDDKRLDEARGYLGDCLGDDTYHFEEDDDEKAQPWWHALGDYVEALPLSDPRLAQIAEYLTPFLDDDDRVDCAMYPGGAAITYIETADWGGDHDQWLTGFVTALGEDWRRWQRILAEKGDAAEWRSPPKSELTDWLTPLEVAQGHV